MKNLTISEENGRINITIETDANVASLCVKGKDGVVFNVPQLEQKPKPVEKPAPVYPMYVPDRKKKNYPKHIKKLPPRSEWVHRDDVLRVAKSLGTFTYLDLMLAMSKDVANKVERNRMKCRVSKLLEDGRVTKTGIRRNIGGRRPAVEYAYAQG